MGEEKLFDPFIIDEYLYDLQAESPATRLQAFQKLLDFSSQESIRLELRKFCFLETDPEVRHFACRHLPAILPAGNEADAAADRSEEDADGSSSLRLELLAARLPLIDDPIKKIAELRKAWSKLGKEAVSVLSSVIEEDKDPVFLAYAIRLIGQNPEYGDADILKKFIDHGNSRVRANAIEALGRMKCQDLSLVLDSFLNDSDNRIRANAILAIFPFDRHKAWEALRSMAESLLESHRDSALYCLSQLSPSDTKGIIRIMLERETVDFLCFKECQLLVPLITDRDETLLKTIATDKEASPTKRGLAKKLLSIIASRSKTAKPAAGKSKKKTCAEAADIAPASVADNKSGQTAGDVPEQAGSGQSAAAVEAKHALSAHSASEAGLSDESPAEEKDTGELLNDSAEGAGDGININSAESGAFFEYAPTRDLEVPQPRLINGALQYIPDGDSGLISVGDEKPSESIIAKAKPRPVKVRTSVSRKQHEVELVPETFMERRIVKFLAFYQKQPKLTTFLTILSIAAVAGLFILAVMPARKRPASFERRTWQSTSGARVVGPSLDRPRPKVEVLSVKGEVTYLGSATAHVKTEGGLYQLKFADGRPEKCQLEALVEARGIYTGYNYASKAIELACEKFIVMRPGRVKE